MSTTVRSDSSAAELSPSRTAAGLSAALLVAAGILIAVAAATTIDSPGGAPTESTSLETIRAVADNRDLFIASTVASFLGLGLFAAGLPALIDLARGRRGRLALAGGALTTVGVVAGAGLNALALSALTVATGGTVDEATAAQLWTYASSTGLFGWFAAGGFLVTLVGLSLLGAALLTARRAPRWLGILAVVAAVLYVAGQVAVGYPLTIVCFLPLAGLGIAGGVLRLRSSQG